ncbi:hypothetical protein PVAND_004772 [Polypedilum vanderplanki]|uniref:Cathepsin propeptide inhibitor domain-containing protein n=1 Tax=Polypedilum vanderplanki TaxID=319348 RepID=A0A9J6BYK9_POLVA|nr:hypothetical protein PVAND_004772 [Polypedilum vanderplanki]
MKSIFCAILVILLPLLVFSLETSNHLAFQYFKTKHSKTYHNKTEEQNRFKIFSENYLFIKKHNKRFQKGLETYELGINQFTDLTRDEFRKLISGIPLPPLSKNSSKTTIKLHEHIRQKRTIVQNESVPINWVAGNLDLRTTAIPMYKNILFKN